MESSSSRLPGANAKSRNWICTISLAVMQLLDVQNIMQHSSISFGIWQHERGAETGHDHIQLYVEFRHAVSLSRLRSLFQDSHCEARRGSRQQAVDYCSKEETRVAGPYSVGTYEEQAPGTRSDIKHLHTSVLSKRSLHELWTSPGSGASMFRYHRGVAVMRATLSLEERRADKPYVVILWGPTGTGKSARVNHSHPESFRVHQPASKSMPVWWDGYEGQHTVLFDDFYGWYKFSALLVLLDRYPNRVDYRGGSAEFVSKRVYITSNVAPRAWYPGVDDARFAALERRFDEVHEVKSMSDVLPELPMPTF